MSCLWRLDANNCQAVMYNELPAACMLSPDGTQHSERHHVTVSNGVGP